MASTDQRIRSLLSGVSRQEGLISSARADRAAAEGDRRNWERRLDEVSAVKRALEGRINTCSGDVSSAQAKAYSELAGATQGFSHEGTLLDAISSGKEKPTEDDALGSQMHADLLSEMDRCRDGIDAATRRIQSANSMEQRAQDQRTSLVRQARSLSESPDSTISVNVRTRY